MGFGHGSRASRLIDYLAGAASGGRLVTYSECMSAPRIADFAEFLGLLSEVQIMQNDLGCDLSALVIGKTTGRPGRGWERGATEGWENAVHRCFRAYAAVGEGNSPQPQSDHGLPYDPGNAGDLLKHGWLAEVVSWLLFKHSGVLRYADPFAGEWDYKLLPPAAARGNRLQGTLLSRYSQSAWRDGRYLGSTGLVAAIASQDHRSAEIWVGDSHHGRVGRLAADHGCLELPCPDDGYAVLKGDQCYDLILLDPFADFLGKARELLPQIIARCACASILLFVLGKPHASRAYRGYLDVLRYQCRVHAVTAVIGGIPALAEPVLHGEGGYDSEVAFIPRRDLCPVAVAEVLPSLAAMAVQVAAALGDSIQARLSMITSCSVDADRC